MTLYEINEEIAKLTEDMVDEETGEINEAVEAGLNALVIQRDEKIENIACVIKNLKADAEAHKAEAKAQQVKAKRAEARAEWLKDYLAALLNGEKFDGVRASVTFRRTKAVECEDVYKVPEEYLRYKEPELDKVAVGIALKGGHEVSGCHLVERVSTIIK